MRKRRGSGGRWVSVAGLVVPVVVAAVLAAAGCGPTTPTPLSPAGSGVPTEELWGTWRTGGEGEVTFVHVGPSGPGGELEVLVVDHHRDRSVEHHRLVGHASRVDEVKALNLRDPEGRMFGDGWVLVRYLVHGPGRVAVSVADRFALDRSVAAAQAPGGAPGGKDAQLQGPAHLRELVADRAGELFHDWVDLYRVGAAPVQALWVDGVVYSLEGCVLVAKPYRDILARHRLELGGDDCVFVRDWDTTAPAVVRRGSAAIFLVWRSTTVAVGEAGVAACENRFQAVVAHGGRTHLGPVRDWGVSCFDFPPGPLDEKVFDVYGGEVKRREGLP